LYFKSGWEKESVGFMSERTFVASGGTARHINGEYYAYPESDTPQGLDPEGFGQIAEMAAQVAISFYEYERQLSAARAGREAEEQKKAVES
jgi:hypothetical protein